jgi:glycosyltransferase involved in cell wall biosynthesis
VVIPTYNYGRFVVEAIDSALAQSDQPLEIIVVDDGSTDDTPSLLQRYRERIRYIRQENRGLSAARNTGIREARGEWIAFLDSDDLWHPHKLERTAAAIAAYPDISAFSTDMITFSQQPPCPVLKQPRRLHLRRLTLRDLIFGVHFSGGSGAVVRKTCFDEIGGFDESLRAVEDLDMWVRLASQSAIGRLREALVFVRVHPTSMSAKAESMEMNHRLMLEKAFSNNPLLRTRHFWQRVATARMHRGVAVMYAEAGNYAMAIRSTFRSFKACLLTSGHVSPFARSRMLVHYLSGLKRQRQPPRTLNVSGRFRTQHTIALQETARSSSWSISVVIPAFNASDTITSALDSIMRQTIMEGELNQANGSIEIIIVDDHSTDGSIEQVKNWMLRHGFEGPQSSDAGLLWHCTHAKRTPTSACLLPSSENRGVGAARNAGIRISHGEWIAFLDADDYWMPWKLSTQLAIAEQAPEYDLWSGATISWQEKKQEEQEELIQRFTPTGSVHYAKVTLDAMCESNPIASSTVLVRRGVLLAENGFSEVYRGPEDYDLWIRLAARYNMARIDMPLALYRQRADSLSMNDHVFLPAVLDVLENAFSPDGALAQLQHRKRQAFSAQYWSAAWMAFCRGDRRTALRHWRASLRSDRWCKLYSFRKRAFYLLRIVFGAVPWQFRQ